MSTDTRIPEDTIVEEYLLKRNMKSVAKRFSLPIGTVRKVIISRCGPLYRFHGLCRVYLYMNNRCFASAREVAKNLQSTYQNIYRVFSELEKRNLGLKVIKVHKSSRTFVYLVWDREECLEELGKEVRVGVAQGASEE
ncbi:MAG: hypothetical protein QXU08_08135 [Ignisphaera sp.]